MNTYVVVHNYAAQRDGKRYGPLRPGELIELSDEEAAWIEADSPGALKLPDADPAEDTTTVPVDQEPAEETKPNRAHKGGRTRAGN